MAYTSLRVLAPPQTEPATIDTLRKHLRIDQDFDDDLLAIYLATARDQAERFLNRALVTQSLQWFLKRESDNRQGHGWGEWDDSGGGFGLWTGPYWAQGRRREAIELPRPPCQSIQSVSLLDRVGNTTAAVALTQASSAGATTLQFASVGFPGFIGNGTFLADLTSNAIPLGATVSGTPVVAAPNVTATLSSPLIGNVGIGDAIIFSSKAPTLPLPVPGTTPAPSPSLYLADLDLDPARLRLNWSILSELGTVEQPIQHIEVDFTAGYGSDGTKVPPSIISAILQLATFLYERRGDDGGEMPEFIRSLLWTDRIVTLGG